MADKILIALSAQDAVVADWRGARIVECRTFPNNEGGQAGFKEFLAPFSQTPVHFVVDAVEEDYRFETLPHASGRDRAEMVSRKLRQHYRNTPYVSASLLGRDTGKRRDDRYLFSALTNPDLINDWLQAVIACGLPVAGIYLLPMVSAAMLERLHARAPNLLIVVQHANGLRLTFFRDRQFRLSRLAGGGDVRGENRARYFAEEISNTRLYLHALRTMTLDEHLTVLLIDRRDELTQVSADIVRENPGLDCLRLGRQELGSQLGMDDETIAASPYAIYLHALALKEPQSNLAPASVTVGFTRYRARRYLYAACGALAAGAAVWIGANLYQAMMLRGSTVDAARQTALLSGQYQEITRQFPQAPASAENLKKGVEIAQKLRAATHGPERLMTLVSQALEGTPNIVVREFGWKYGATPIETQAGGQRLDTETSTTPAPEPGAPAGPALLRRESALIDGEIRPFRGDYRSAIAAINAFAGRIAKAKQVAEVRVVKLPLNVNPGQSLAGNTQVNPDQSGATAEFQVLLVLRPDA